jgi:hypothetical protein
MQCSQHPETAATAYCTNCGIAICADCQQTIDSRVVCPICVAQLSSSPSPQRPPSPVGSVADGQSSGGLPGVAPPSLIPPERGYPYCSPGVCFVLGLIPGVGAICNGEYLRAFLQVLVFGTLVSIASSGEAEQYSPMLVILAIALYLYMPLEAYHISKKRTLALKGVIVMTPFDKLRFSEIWSGALAIGLGTMFLVNQYVPGTIRFFLRGWPFLLIGLGAYNLLRYFKPNATTT